MPGPPLPPPSIPLRVSPTTAQDAYGSDRLGMTTAVLAAVRAAVGADGVVALRLSCDELAPWAWVTPEQAAEQVAVLAELVDALVVVRGAPYSTWAYRPDAHTQAGFNTELCGQMRRAASGRPRRWSCREAWSIRATPRPSWTRAWPTWWK